jgi:hypothetical protein
MDKKRILYIIIIGLFLTANLVITHANAADDTLAEQYAPILYFVEGEKCFPVNITYALENSYLFQIGNPTPISTQPTEELLSIYTSSDDFYLDNQQGTVAVGDDGIENNYQMTMMTHGYTVYARVDPANTTIQYWFFYAFNNGDLNRHEGDWEMVQVVLSNNQPAEVMFSQHTGGQKATWNQVDKEGDHVKVYVARGSHANYIKSYSGKLGVASDIVGDNGRTIKPLSLQSDGYSIVMLESQPWLEFSGHWGWVGADDTTAAQAVLLGEAGPNGPKFREDGSMWQPQAWAAQLQPANDLFFIFEWLVYNFIILFILATVLSVIILVFLLFRRKKKYGLGPRLFSLLYIDGGNQKSIGNILCIIAIVLTIIALFQPWYLVTADVTTSSSERIGSFVAVSVDGINGIQIQLPNRTGPVPLGALSIPFYLIIGIGLVFLVLSTIGISQSQKLGKKYIFRGFRLFIPFILILVFILTIASFIPLLAPANVEGNPELNSAMHAISVAPFSGEYALQISDADGGSIQLSWGFGVGAYLLLFAGIFLIMGGIMLLVSHEQFFAEKSPIPNDIPKEPVKKDIEKRE